VPNESGRFAGDYLIEIRNPSGQGLRFDDNGFVGFLNPRN
jgi:hypothetical protein